MKTLSYYLLLIIFCLALYLPGMTTLPLPDRDSAHFAEASRQMIQSHDYWDINFQNEPRHLKPPGLYWLHTVSVNLLSNAKSNQTWPYTLISILGGMLAVLLTFTFARKRYTQKVALLAAALLAASPLLILEAHLIVTDALFLTTVIIMQGALWQIYVNQRQNMNLATKTPNHHMSSVSSTGSHWLLPGLFWLGMSAGILVKGIAPLFALLTIISLCLVDRNIRWCKNIKLQWGIPLVLTLTTLWLLPLSWHSHSNFLFDMIKKDALPKLISGQQSHGMPPGFFLLLFTWLFWPAALFLWQAVRWSYDHRHQADVRFLLAWIIPAWLFFEITPTKLPEYILPLFPAIAVIFAQAILSNENKNLTGLWRWLTFLHYILWIFLGIVLVIIFGFAPYYFEHKLFVSSIVSGIILVVTMVFAMFTIKRGQFYQTILCNLLGILLSMMLIFEIALPSLQAFWITKNVVHIIHKKIPRQINKQTPLYTVGYREPSLVFMLGADNVIPLSANIAATEMAHHQIRFILINNNKIFILKSTLRNSSVKLKRLGEITGFNYSKGRWTTLTLYKQEKVHEHTQSQK